MQKKQGISLIVLSITILVMAILAATAIIALEDSGIIGRSKNTVNKQNYTEEYTRLQVIKNGVLTDNLGVITVDEYITELSNKGLIEAGVTNNADGSKTVITKTGFEVTVTQKGTSNINISIESYEQSNRNDETSDKVLITFTLTTSSVSNVAYQAEEGMTWRDWVGSEYDSNSGLIIGLNQIGDSTTEYVWAGQTAAGLGGYAIYIGAVPQRADDEIIANTNYHQGVD